ncbi:MAG: 7-carboxy-7-deazaguanine synthase QueE [Bacteroidota bacterium]
MEHFYTIQGEGFHQGRAAYFIRLGGCDVGCVWCDVKESWDASKHTLFSVDEIVKFCTDANANLAVITGGEPLMYDLSELTKALHQKNIDVNIETSGAYPLSGDIDWICVSPKKFKAPLDDVLSKAHELKVVIFNNSDFDWAEKNTLKVSNNCQLYLQPEWDRSSQILSDIIEFVKQNPRWKISLQTHKYMNIP